MITNTGETIKKITEKLIRTGLPEFKVGDTIKMMIKVQEADKVRLHPFEGTVIGRTTRGINSTFTVRKVAFGEGVERIFTINSPVIESLKIVSKGLTHRAKLTYLRNQVGKKANVKRDVSQDVSQDAPQEVNAAA